MDGNSEAKVNHQLVRLLESALTDAKAGRVTAGGVALACGPSNFVAFAAFGNQPGEVIAAGRLMEADILTAMRQARSPAIMRAGPMTNLRN